MSVTLIWATTSDGCIGRDNALPWAYNKHDMAWFEAHTRHVGTVMMGRKTFESLPNGPLVDRQNIVVTRRINESLLRQASDSDESIVLTNDPHKTLRDYANSENELMVMGGKSLYELALPYADRVLVTLFGVSDLPCDTYFQPDLSGWTVSEVSSVHSTSPSLYFFEGHRDCAKTNQEDV